VRKQWGQRGKPKGGEQFEILVSNKDMEKIEKRKK